MPRVWEMDQERRAFFVISTGRCGSTAFSNVMRTHPEILSLSEVFSTLGGPRAFGTTPVDGSEFWRFLSALDADLAAVLRSTQVPEILLNLDHGLDDVSSLALVALPHVSSNHDRLLQEVRGEVSGYAHDESGRHFARLFEWLRKRLDRRVWVERSGGSVEYADRLRSVWPNAGFIYLLRDGRECAYSMSRHPLFKVRVARLVSGAASLDVRLCLQMEIPVHRFGAYWSALMVQMERTLSSVHAGRKLIVRYEDLVADARGPLERITAFMGLSLRPELWADRVAGSLQSRPSHWTQLPGPERRQLERACRPGMRIMQRIACPPE
jgi:hypothetical protein